MPSLSDLKVGDEVVLNHNSLYGCRRTVCSVAKVTSTQLHVSGWYGAGLARFRKDTGRMVGSHGYSSTSIEPATPELIAEVVTEKRQKELARRLREVKWADLPVDTLEAIAALLPPSASSS